MEEFELNKTDFIELNKLMKVLSWVNSGGEANIMITEGEVLVNKEVAYQKRKKIRKGDQVQFRAHQVIVAG